MDGDRQAPHTADAGVGADSQRALVEQVAERVYRLMRDELRLERARGGSVARATGD